MKLKRVLSLAVACLMLCTLFGCGAAAGSSENTSSTESVAAVSDWDYISGKGELIVGMTLFAPMNYTDAAGELTGFETEFAKAVAAKLGVNVKFQEIDWLAKETELNAKNIDCIWNGMTIDEDRKATMDISVAYMQNKQVLVTKSANAGKYTDAASLKGAVVVAEQGSAGETVVSEGAIFAEANYTAVDTQAKALMEVAAGTADAAVIDYVMSIGSIGEGTDYANIAVVPNMEFAPEEYGIAFRKNSPVTLEKVNGAIAALAADGTLNTIAAKYKLAELILVK